MWFAKWFGGRNDEVQDSDEPARFERLQPAPHSSPARRASATKKTGSVKGFDPYNSGAFEKRNAWEKVSKR